MAKRGRLEIIKDILSIISSNHNSIKITPLIRKSNLSSSNFKEYYSELLKKGFIKEVNHSKNKFISLSDRGLGFLEKYKTIIGFINEFEL
jgi:predicted transcriptional regulator